MRVVLPDRQIGTVRMKIYNSMGITVVDQNILHTFKDIPIEINIQQIPAGVYTIVITNSETKVTDKASFVIMHRK
ncbi:MAG: T9SS type A sorting domain-containing protein [Bacteroidales bacterium]|nr:T9SS type A sorting domain-containing protein [Bacteroidales bacterium]